MPKTKSQIPQGSFALLNKCNGKGEQAIYLRYFAGKYVKRSTDIWILPEDWDKAKQEVKPRNRNAARINNRLADIKQKVDAQLIAYSEGVLSPEVVLRMMDGSFVPEDQRAKRTLFIDYAKDVNELLYKRGDYGYAVFYNKKLSIEAFGRFVEDELGMQPLSLNQVTLELIDKYVTYRREKLHNTSIEGINKTLVPLVRSLEYAKDNGLLDPKVAMPVIENAYLETKGRHYDPDTVKKEKVRFLTPDQFSALLNYKPSSNSKERTKELLDIFFFSYYSCGLRVSDVITLEWSQVDWSKKRIDKVQVKTKQRGKIQPLLSPQAIDILNRWKEKGRNSRFVFDFFPEGYQFSQDEKSQREFKMRCNSVERTLNQSLNAIGRKLGFPYALSMHVARHTFCVNAISNGFSLHFISQLMGHQSILATEKTYAEFLETTIDKEMEKIENLYQENL